MTPNIRSSDDGDDEEQLILPQPKGWRTGAAMRRRKAVGDADVAESSSDGDRASSVGSAKSSSVFSVATQDEMQTIKEELTKEETKQVFRLRVIVILLLIGVSVGISYIFFKIVHTAEVKGCDIDYMGTAIKMINRLSKIEEKLASLPGLALSATAEAIGQGSDWPFVTLNMFHEQAINAQALSGALWVGISPVVTNSTLLEWEDYVQGDASAWIDRGYQLQEAKGINNFTAPNQPRLRYPVDPLHTFTPDGTPLPSQAAGPFFLPVWQSAPVLHSSVINENLLERKELKDILEETISQKTSVLGGFQFAPPGNTSHVDPDTAYFSTLLSMRDGAPVDYLGDPMSYISIPIFGTAQDDDSKSQEVVGVLTALIHWKSYVNDMMDDIEFGYNIVLEHSCEEESNQYFTFEISGGDLHGRGFGDWHDPMFSMMNMSGHFGSDNIQDGTNTGMPFQHAPCPYQFHIYLTMELAMSHLSSAPTVMSASVAAVFFFTIFMFVVYDRLVERRQKVVLAKASQSTAIVSSLFPKKVRDRLLNLETERNEKRKGAAMMTHNQKIKSFLNGGTDLLKYSEDHLADLFPHCTVMFADIVGFTAWSSIREPSQVFTLLQSVYKNFDDIAHQQRVFKVETIGDSYLAATGLPEPQPKHASIMVNFATACLQSIGDVTRELEAMLGPDTKDLSLRIGLNSGAVTGGVLMGDRARFQIFGDTVNTASRMESTSMKGCIQCSVSTAQALVAEGHESWLNARKDLVEAKGKGMLNTFWVSMHKEATTATTVISASSGHLSASSLSSQPKRIQPHRDHPQLVDWCTDLLLQQIKKVVIVHQRCSNVKGKRTGPVTYRAPDGTICLDEVKNAIHTPDFDANVAEATLDWRLVKVPIDIMQQLRTLVDIISQRYQENPFHNFEHACHVTMSVAKLLSRVVTPDLAPTTTTAPTTSAESVVDQRVRKRRAEQIHKLTHGITSDPMLSLALVFSALIHDVDHAGVSNMQLAKEQPELARHYRNKSIAEQNSLDMAWDILMSTEFASLRKYIFESQDELLRFRQLIVNGVLATDIFDKELGERRKSRWQKAFHENLPDSITKDLRATIVMEHIIQASDVSHTMQHWHVYQKWNRRLFQELYQAHRAGRMGANPATFWYNGELGFFDNYIIPLAQKLEECQVFGVSSDEYLQYAKKNRAEWEIRGKEIVATLVAEAQEVEAGG